MSKYCSMCGMPIPDDQGSKTCSMCYGDIDHGKDGYYREWAERQAEEDVANQWHQQELDDTYGPED